MKKITAIIVAYNSLLSSLNSIQAQVDRVIVIDNGSETNKLEAIMQGDKLEIIRNKTNLGLAAAQNIGIRRAFERSDCDGILLLDDDSEAEKDMVAKMVTASEQYPPHKRVGIITPRIRDINTDKDYPCLLPYNKLFFRRAENKSVLSGLLCALASGSLIKREVFEEIGLMREEFFIDYIDWDFCLRAKISGWDIMAAGDALLHHRLGKKTPHRLFGRTVFTTNQSAERRYTAARNRIICWRLYGTKLPAFVTYTAAALFYEIILLMLFEKNRLNKFVMIIKGTLAGLFTKPEKVPSLS